MENSAEVKRYDVIIVGSGPSGCACALTLKDAGLKVALLDKSTFPRDKVCGDAIPGLAIKTLKSISPVFYDSFRIFQKKFKTSKTTVYYKKTSIDFNWKGEAYTSTRLDFDNFLYSLVKESTSADIYLNAAPSDITITKDEVSVREKNSGTILKAAVMIGADGAQSVVAKQLANRTVDRNHYVGSVRAYYSNVSNTTENTTEVYLIKKILPGYLWLFPLPGNKANVGFGMLSATISKRKLNLKKTFHELITQTPELAERFKDATQIGELEGFGLPLGSRRVQVSGDRFMLVGDAASLIDPISGDGIGNAMFSGHLAAKQILKSFAASNFSVAFIQSYDKELFKAIGPDLQLRFKMQRIISTVPFLVTFVFWLLKSKRIKNIIQKYV